MTVRFKRYINDPETNKFYKTYKWQQKRKEILNRDNYECQVCKSKGRFHIGECVHHKKELKLYPELAMDNDNLITLCNRCHNLIHEKHLNRKKEKRIISEERW